MSQIAFALRHTAVIGGTFPVGFFSKMTFYLGIIETAQNEGLYVPCTTGGRHLCARTNKMRVCNIKRIPK